MSKTKKILIAYDGSRSSAAALADLRLAGLGSKVEAKVVTVADLWVPAAEALSSGAEGWFSPAFTAAKLQSRDALREAGVLAQKAAATLRKNFRTWKVTSESVTDSPAHGILRLAEKWKPSLIVVGSQGHSALGALLLGSVSRKVLTHASGNIRISRPAPARGNAPRILAAVDGSKDAEAALREIAGREWPRGAEFRVAVVVDFRLALAESYYAADRAKSAGTLADKTALKAQRILAENGLKVTAVVCEGDPRRELMKEIKRFKANGLFMGCRGLGAVKRFFLGSVSLALAERAPCTVEVIRK